MTMAALGRGKICCMVGSPAPWLFVRSVHFVILFLFAWLEIFGMTRRWKEFVAFYIGVGWFLFCLVPRDNCTFHSDFVTSCT